MMFRCFCYFYNAISVSESGVTHDVNSKTSGRNTLFRLVWKKEDFLRNNRAPARRLFLYGTRLGLAIRREPTNFALLKRTTKNAGLHHNPAISKTIRKIWKLMKKATKLQNHLHTVKLIDAHITHQANFARTQELDMPSTLVKIIRD